MVASHIPLRANRRDLDVIKSRVPLRPQTKQWHKTPPATTTEVPWGQCKPEISDGLKLAGFFTFLYIHMCVSKFVQREGWLLHRMRHLLNYCQGRAGQWGSQGRGWELNSSWSWEGSVQPSEEGRKKTQTRESKGKQCKAVQGWASILFPWSVCSITQHWRIK